MSSDIDANEAQSNHSKRPQKALSEFLNNFKETILSKEQAKSTVKAQRSGFLFVSIWLVLRLSFAWDPTELFVSYLKKTSHCASKKIYKFKTHEN